MEPSKTLSSVHFEQGATPSKLMIDEATQSALSFADDFPELQNKYFHDAPKGLTAPKSQASVLSGGSRSSMGFDSQGQPVRIQPKHYEDPASFVPNGVDSRLSDYGEQRWSSRQLGRSKSLPRRRVEKDPFEGVEPGWWSKGEVMRNKDRREMVEKGRSVTGGDWNASREQHNTPKRTWRPQEEFQNIPAAGYSGHIQGLRHLGIGKSFNTAAREAKQQYVERRRARSGSRDQFYSRSGSQIDAGSEQLNYSHAAMSGMHGTSPY